jgi:hypothetical protein
MHYRLTTSLLSVLLLAATVGCDKASPVAPEGTLLTLSANPSKIGLNGQSTITVVGRKPDGNPLNPGTEVRLSTDRGTIDSIVTVDDNGRATATLRGDGRAGTAAVKAEAANASVTTNVQIGESDETRPSLILTVNPSVISTEDSATVTVIARNVDGSPAAAGQRVTLTSTLGTLSPARPEIRNDGTATSTLTSGRQSGTATVTAVLGSSEAATAEVEIRSAILTLTADRTSIPEQTQTVIRITARLTDFQGEPISGRPIDFRSDRGSLSPTTQNTGTDGLATVMLTVNAGEVTSDETFQVTATTFSGGGDPLTQTLNITIENTIR